MKRKLYAALGVIAGLGAISLLGDRSNDKISPQKEVYGLAIQSDSRQAYFSDSRLSKDDSSYGLNSGSLTELIDYSARIGDAEVFLNGTKLLDTYPEMGPHLERVLKYYALRGDQDNLFLKEHLELLLDPRCPREVHMHNWDPDYQGGF